MSGDAPEWITRWFRVEAVACFFYQPPFHTDPDNFGLPLEVILIFMRGERCQWIECKRLLRCGEVVIGAPHQLKIGCTILCAGFLCLAIRFWHSEAVAFVSFPVEDIDVKNSIHLMRLWRQYVQLQGYPHSTGGYEIDWCIHQAQLNAPNLWDERFRTILKIAD